MSHSSKENNFNLLRVCFALFVLITHASELTTSEDSDWLSSVSNGITTFSHLGISGFFTISGYLVYQSFLRSSTFMVFLKKRILRIFPGLFINLLVITFLIGPFLTSNPVQLYTSFAPYRFFLFNLTLVNIAYSLGDIFSTNPYPNVVNGSLWTLIYEFVFYCSFIILFLLKQRQVQLLLRFFPLLIGIVIWMQYWPIKWFIPYTSIGIHTISYLLPWFMIGMWLSYLKENNRLYSWMFPIAILGFLLTIASQLPYFVLSISWPVVVIFLGNVKYKLPSPGFLQGDPSYGIYIYGFFLQQLLIYFGVRELPLHLVLAVSVSTIVGYASWHLVEKKALKLKPSN